MTAAYDFWAEQRRQNERHRKTERQLLLALQRLNKLEVENAALKAALRRLDSGRDRSA